MLLARNLLKKFIHFFGFDIVRYSLKTRGENPYLDMTHYLRKDVPVIFDVGANLGESLASFLSVFPAAQIHCFEPSSRSYQVLSQKYSNYKNISLYCKALGANVSSRYFNDNEFAYLSSFLELGAYGYGNILSRRLISVDTVDNFAKSIQLKNVDIIKIDTQGFEYDVILGCSDLLSSGNIRLIHVELTFTEMYLDLPCYRLILEFLHANKFVLCGIYRQHFQKGFLSWADALFVRID